MSHFSTLSLQIKDKDCLCEALKTLGLNAVAHKTPIALKDYCGNKTEITCDVVVDRATMGNRCSDIGYSCATKSFTVDSYNNPTLRQHGDKFLDKVKQEYAISTLQKQAKAKGKVLHRVAGEKGKIHCFVSA